MFDEDYAIKLDIFEGPMDLLVYLVRKNDLDIYNIPISFITEQFLAYIELMKSMNIDLASEFLYMTATLTHIKSRMLLPSPIDDSDEDDPRMEIARPLLEYLQLKSAASHLSNRALLGEDTFIGNPPEDELNTAQNDKETMRIGLFELVDAFRNITENTYPDHSVDFSSNKLSVKNRIIDIVHLLEKNNSISFQKIFEENTNKNNMVISFIAILEMAKLNLIELRQHIQSGTIRIFYL